MKGLQNDEKVSKLPFRVDPEAVCSLTIGGLQGQFSPPNEGLQIASPGRPRGGQVSSIFYQVSSFKYQVSSIKCQVSSIKVSSIKPATNQPKIGFYSREGVYG